MERFKKCPICGKIFELNSFGRPRKYCSDECRWQAEFKIRKEVRIIEQKCEYCGRIFKANKKWKYCSDDCSEKANQDNMNKRNSWRWYHDREYRKMKKLKHRDSLGTIIFQANEDNDWEKELIILKALKKKAGLN